MIATRLTESRDELLELVRYVRGLARESSTEVDSGDDALIEQSQRPFRIAVVGPREVGKTSFFEQLVSCKFDKAWARAGGVMIVRDIGHRVFVDYEKACKIHYQSRMRGVELVEFSDLAKMDSVQRLAAEKLLRGADFTFYLISAENPWDAPTWNTISDSFAWTEEKAALVLHKTDTRLEKDLGILQQHMRELCAKKLKAVLPDFATSLKRPNSIQLLREFLDDTLERSRERRRSVRMVYDSCYALLRRCEQAVDDQVRELKGDQEFLQSVEAQVVRFREQKITEVQDRIGELGGLMDTIEPKVYRYMAWRTGVLGSMVSVFGNGSLAMKVESYLCKKLQEEATDYAQEEASKMIDQCREEWHTMRPSLQQRLSVDVAEFDEDTFADLGEEFIESSAAAVSQAVVSMRLRGSVDSLVHRRHRIQQRIAQLVLLLLFLGLTWGAFVSENPFHLFTQITLGLAVVLMLVGAVYAKRSQEELMEVFFEAYDTTAGSLTMGVGEAHLDRMRVFFTGFTPMFESTRKHIAREQQSLGPLEKVAANLYLRLRSWESSF
ncbi:GTPase domain-containing protein [Rubritalea marina]|uniref:GTPase domain-containing protein n=1 Tax=Rubritalea marina TaxID=361055 RepID=UPI0003789886|nr:GTPase domain-containing protein [Rubritalea marina]